MVGLLLGTIVGCSEPPPLDKAEYGEILTELPKVPGAETPFPLPRLEEQDPPSAGQPAADAAAPELPGAPNPPAEPATGERPAESDAK